jgi:hypothetical protein
MSREPMPWGRNPTAGSVAAGRSPLLLVAGEREHRGETVRIWNVTPSSSSTATTKQYRERGQVCGDDPPSRPR